MAIIISSMDGYIPTMYTMSCISLPYLAGQNTEDSLLQVHDGIVLTLVTIHLLR